MSARSAFKELSPNDILDPKYDRTRLANHALKVFLMSYPEVDQQMLDTNQLFAKKLKEYKEVICDLFGIDGSRLLDVTKHWKEMADNGVIYVLTVAVKRFKSRDRVESPEFEAKVKDKEQKIVFDKTTLDIDSEVQTNQYSSTQIELDVIKELRKENAVIELGFAGKTIEIRFGQIHAEGYQQWIEFAEEVKLLIEITLATKQQRKCEEGVDFHLHTLCLMVEKRLSHYEVKGQSGQSLRRPVVWHKRKTRNNVISFERPLVEPNTDEYFWRISVQDWRQKLRQNVDSGGKVSVRDVISSSVNYLDIQTSTTYGADIEGFVCLCNEWCNWNSFFYHNPIYRFIIVQNSHLFLTYDCLHIPDLYLYASSVHTVIQTVCNDLVLSLVTSAHENRAQYHRLNVISEGMVNLYHFQTPEPINIIGNVYKFLRYNQNIVEMCQKLDVNPFADICIDSILNHTKVLSGLHFEISEVESFVDDDDQDDWNDDLEAICCKLFADFFIKAYNKAFDLFDISDPTGQSKLTILLKDRIFGSDFEYLNYIPKNENEFEIKNQRIKALQWGRAEGQSANALNMSVRIDPLIHHLIQVYKFFYTIDTKFTKASEEDAKEAVDKYCLKFDEDFNNRLKKISKIEFTISESELRASGLPEDKHHWMYAFYTLKLYSFGFRIQEHCIEGRVNFIKGFKDNVTLIADEFEFIFHIQVIDGHRIALFSDLVLQNLMIIKRFKDFYEIFWEKPKHETQTPLPEDTRERKLFIYRSASEQFRKLYVWTRSGGNQKPRFTQILRHFNRHLKDLFKRSVQIEEDLIFPAIIWLGTEKAFNHNIEVMDVLAIYLVRANCVCLLKTIHTFFRQIHLLQPQNLSEKCEAFSLGKPGWVQLLRTMNNVFAALDRLRDRYIGFDDEIERIVGTVYETRQLCRMFYKLMYKKLLYDSGEELWDMYQFYRDMGESHVQILDETLTLQFVVTFTLFAAFVDQFRKDFDQIRRQLYKYYKDITRKANALTAFGGLLSPMTAYLSDQTAIRAAEPFNTGIWSEYLERVLPNIRQFDASFVNLDMAAADRVV